MRHPISKELLKELEENIREFGTYNFYDKGVGETILDFQEYEKGMQQLPFEEFMQIVCDLLEHKYGKEFATDFCEDSEHNFGRMKQAVEARGIKVENYSYFSDVQREPVKIGNFKLSNLP